MKKDIILSGVGGQGILTIATIIGDAATKAGIHLKQAEVHGMSQRGGDVQSNLRLSESPIHSDLIALGRADLIISMEPMEALRYLPYLSQGGQIVTSSHPFKNIPNYPDDEAWQTELNQLNNVCAEDIDQLAKDNNIPKCANIILLGMAARHILILSPTQLRESIISIFTPKGEQVVAMNLQAFDLGMQIAG